MSLQTVVAGMLFILSTGKVEAQCPADPVIVSTMNTPFVHETASIFLEAQGVGGVGQYPVGGTWSVDPGAGVALDVVTFYPNVLVTGITAGSTTVSYTATDGGSCTATATFEVIVIEPLNLSILTSPANVGCGATFTATVYASGNFTDLTGLDFSLNWDDTQLEYVTSTVYKIGTSDPVVNVFSASE
ncbi:MAG: hypothetical protein ACR2K1_04405, partial [Saprospiraceae bacterium]